MFGIFKAYLGSLINNVESERCCHFDIFDADVNHLYFVVRLAFGFVSY